MNKGAPLRRTVIIPLPDAHLQGELCIPEGSSGLVMFVHGSGSSRHSPRNAFVAGVLNDAGIATLLFDLLTPHEEAIDVGTGELRFNIKLLAQRVVDATNWVLQYPPTSKLKLGYFGASTGAAAALSAAAVLPDHISAVVSRGGRPDLALSVLNIVQAPTLLIVGGNDATVLALNQTAAKQLNCEKTVEVILGAGHLFEEQGALASVAHCATRWFVQHFDNAPDKSAISCQSLV